MSAFSVSELLDFRRLNDFFSKVSPSSSFSSESTALFSSELALPVEHRLPGDPLGQWVSFGLDHLLEATLVPLDDHHDVVNVQKRTDVRI